MSLLQNSDNHNTLQSRHQIHDKPKFQLKQNPDSHKILAVKILDGQNQSFFKKNYMNFINFQLNTILKMHRRSNGS